MGGLRERQRGERKDNGGEGREWKERAGGKGIEGYVSLNI